MEDFEGGVRDVDVRYENKEPEALQERMTPQPFGDLLHFDSGEQEDDQEEEENVKGRGILETQSAQGSEVGSDAEVKGEIRIEESQESEGVVAGSVCQENVHSLCVCVCVWRGGKDSDGVLTNIHLSLKSCPMLGTH